MKTFTKTLTFNPKDNPNIVGEILRDMFFDQSRGLGCYSSFTLKENVVDLPLEKIDRPYAAKEEEDLFWKKATTDGVVMRYFWCSVGVLEFIFEDGSSLKNWDCKKDYLWEYREPNASKD
jgi:hypothetical protein